MKGRPVLALAAMAASIVLAGCTAGRNPLTDSPASPWCCAELGGDSAGFWLGLWRGLIAPLTLIVSLFSSETSLYEVHNNGGWYNAGFLLGLMTTLGGSGGAASSRRSRDGDDDDDDEAEDDD
jgi:hypothetical protein